MLASVTQRVTRYDSLESLFAALATGRTPRPAHGGYVSVHPNAMSSRAIADALAPREHLARFGLQLLVTPLVGPAPVELRPFSAELGAAMEFDGP